LKLIYKLSVLKKSKHMKTKNVRDQKEVSGKLLKCTVLVSAILFQTGAIFSQQVYDNFEGNKVVYYGQKSGVLDTLVKNPAPNDVNNSEKCAMYVRNRAQKFDNIKMPLKGHLVDVSPYATYLGVPPKIKMKIYTTAPVGTLVEILLGNKFGNNAYPGGTNSQYQAHTKVSGAWEEIEFLFAQIPEGSETSTTQIDQVTLLFDPNTTTSDTYYFDDITGPMVAQDTAKAPVIIPKENKKK
jgi:hypothetical protein